MATLQCGRSMSRDDAIHQKVIEEAHAGSRCVICGQLLNAIPTLADGECGNHEEEELGLARIAITLRVELRAKLLVNVHKDSKDLHQQVSGTQKRITDALIFRRQCQKSLYYLDQSCHTQFLAREDTMGVDDVFEMEFSTHHQYGYNHNVFLISMSNGNLYVFDPTGIQFGASWPLLQRLEPYLQFRVNLGSKITIDDLFSYGDYFNYGVKPEGMEYWMVTPPYSGSCLRG